VRDGLALPSLGPRFVFFTIFEAFGENFEVVWPKASDYYSIDSSLSFRNSFALFKAVSFP
jgi:hypothetical protein